MQAAYYLTVKAIRSTESTGIVRRHGDRVTTLELVHAIDEGLEKYFASQRALHGWPTWLTWLT